MIHLYHASGAGDFTIVGDPLDLDQCRILIENAAKLLTARREVRASKLLCAVPFRIFDATNRNCDEFSILHAIVPLEDYEKLRVATQDETDRRAFVQVANVLSEIGPYIRFISVELLLNAPIQAIVHQESGLKPSEINKLVYRYIGVSGGYLGDFSYRSHFEFYIDLDLDIDPYRFVGTTRERFIKILTESAPLVQARILEGVLGRFPAGSNDLRVPEREAEIRGWITRLRSNPGGIVRSETMMMKNDEQSISPKVFICYAKQDQENAALLYDHLEKAGASPWMDKRKLVLGDDWESEIKLAVTSSDVFVVCLRHGFDNIGFRQKEVRWALEALQLRPPGKGFVIPYIVEPCELPNWCKPIHAGNDLTRPTNFGEIVRTVEKHAGASLRTFDNL